MKEVTDTTFNHEVLAEKGMVVVDFWAPWCGPCLTSAPAFEAIAKDRPDIKFVKVNVDDCRDTPATYGVRGIPTFILFENGNVVDVHVGAVTKSMLQGLIAKAPKQ